MSKRDLDNFEYDNYLVKNKKERELRERHAERKNANKGYEGWHFGIDSKPVYAKNKDDFRRKLAERGLMMKEDVRRELR